MSDNSKQVLPPDDRLTPFQWALVGLMTVPAALAVLPIAFIAAPVFGVLFAAFKIYEHYESLKKLKDEKDYQDSLDKYEKARIHLAKRTGRSKKDAIRKILEARRIGISIRGCCLFQELTPTGYADDRDEEYARYTKFGDILKTISVLRVERDQVTAGLPYDSESDRKHWHRILTEWMNNHPCYKTELLEVATKRFLATPCLDALLTNDDESIDYTLETLASIQRVADRVLRDTE